MPVSNGNQLKYFSSSGLIIGVLADGVFKLLDTLRHPDNFLLQGSLLRLKVAELLVEANGFGAHRAIMTVDFLLDAVKLISEGFASILTLHSQDILKGFLLAAQDLHFLLVSGEVLVELTAGLCQVSQFALKVSSVLRALSLTNSGLAYKQSANG